MEGGNKKALGSLNGRVLVRYASLSLPLDGERQGRVVHVLREEVNHGRIRAGLSSGIDGGGNKKSLGS
jgi:hypothetical protein